MLSVRFTAAESQTCSSVDDVCDVVVVPAHTPLVRKVGKLELQVIVLALVGVKDVEEVNGYL